MAKRTKYIFDPQSLSMKKESLNKKEIIKNFFLYISFTIVLFTLTILFVFYVFDSPKERQLRRDLEQAQMQYRQLDKRVDLLSSVLKDIQARDENLYRIIFEAEPPGKDSRLLGNETYEEFRTNTNAELIVNTSLKVDDLTKRIYSQSKSFDDVYKMAKNKKEMLACMPAILPVNKKMAQVHSGFGIRLHPIFREYIMHTGIDFNGAIGTPIYATGDGVVKISGQAEGYGGYGIVVVINHGFGFQSLYGHLSKTASRVGQKIKRGDLIGYMGSTGTSTGSHLHYEVILNGKKTNPVYYFFNDLTPQEYEKVLEKANEVNQSLS